MPDPIVPDAIPAGSSPAAESAPASDPLDALSASELQTWRETGDMPSTSPVTDAAAASSTAPAVKDQPASTDAPAQAASEPAASPTPGADKRIPELLRDRAAEKDRADRAERRLAEIERARTQPPPDARPAASSAAPAGLVEPSADDFPFGSADPGYVKAVAKYEAAQFIAGERATFEEGQRQARARDEAARVMQGFEERRTAAKARHADFDAVAMLAPTEIPQGSALDLFILEDPSGAEVLYHLQLPANAAERTRISRLAPLDQIKEAVRLGDRLTAAEPATRSTQAPPPPPTLSTRATPGDAAERALAMGDGDDATGSWMAAENARDLARLKR